MNIVWSQGGRSWDKPAAAGRAARSKRGTKTREERRRARWVMICRLAVAGAFALLLLLAGLGGAAGDGGADCGRIADTAAAYAAAQEYDRIMALYGDKGAAEQLARDRYEEVLAEWDG